MKNNKIIDVKVALETPNLGSCIISECLCGKKVESEPLEDSKDGFIYHFYCKSCEDYWVSPVCVPGKPWTINLRDNDEKIKMKYDAGPMTWHKFPEELPPEGELLLLFVHITEPIKRFYVTEGKWSLYHGFYDVHRADIWEIMKDWNTGNNTLEVWKDCYNFIERWAVWNEDDSSAGRYDTMKELNNTIDNYYDEIPENEEEIIKLTDEIFKSNHSPISEDPRSKDPR